MMLPWPKMGGNAVILSKSGKKRTFPLHFQKIYLPLQPQNKEGALAQVVEHRTENPCVLGSTPRDTTLQKKENHF